MRSKHKMVIVLVVAVAVVAGVGIWSTVGFAAGAETTQANGVADPGKAMEVVRSRVEAMGGRVSEMSLDGTSLKLVLDVSQVDPSKADMSLMLDFYRAAADQGITWLEYGPQGGPMGGMLLPKVAPLPPIEASTASAVATSWLQEQAEASAVKAEVAYDNYRADIVATGDVANLQTFVERVVNGGQALFERGQLAFVYVKAYSDGKLVCETAKDYQLGIAMSNPSERFSINY